MDAVEGSLRITNNARADQAGGLYHALNRGNSRHFQEKGGFVPSRRNQRGQASLMDAVEVVRLGF